MSWARARAAGTSVHTARLVIPTKGTTNRHDPEQRRTPCNVSTALDRVKPGCHAQRVPTGNKLRCHGVEPAFQVCLVEPEIPPNTGSVARTCGATQSILHLVEPLGFSLDERAVRRAGLDYWHLVDVRVHRTFEAFQASCSGTLHFFSAGAARSYLEAPLRPGDCLVFGRESVGLPLSLLDAHADRVWGIPTIGAVRSLNLSNAVSIVLYDALRRTGALDHTFVEFEQTP
jgi:tRNA (cytidine/uridine-2'-O-)-methyltransferase